LEPSPKNQHTAPKRARWFKAVPAAVTLVIVIVAASADYTVQRGDTLNQIAAELGVSKADLIALNGIPDPDLIRVGQVLVVPGQTAAAATPAPAPGATHTVVAGETLASIAAQHGTTVETIAAANGLTNTALIYIGTTLQLTSISAVPAPSATPSVATHVVAAGESLADVAASYGTTVEALVAANGITDPNLIRVGQQIQVQAAAIAWTCPVPGARYFNDWGFPRSGGRFHQGNDLFAPTGTPVLAPVSGTARFLQGPIGGLQFRLYGDDGTTYIGSHLDTFAGTDGYVTAGAQLGTVGQTGNAVGSQPHLHFETHPGDGPAVNPYPTLEGHGC
jgi:LysM repeat protein